MFYIGQKVVCVNDSEREFLQPNTVYVKRPWLLVKGKVYTISELINLPNRMPGLLLEEIPDRNCPIEPGYARERFKPVIEKKTDISIFKAMLNKTPQQNRKELLNV